MAFEGIANLRVRLAIDKRAYEHEPQQPVGLSCFSCFGERLWDSSLFFVVLFPADFESESFLLKIFFIEKVIGKFLNYVMG